MAVDNIIDYKNYLIDWIKKQVNQAGAQGVIVGMSGGIDSSVVAALAKEAFPENSLGVLLPVNDMGQDFHDAQAVVQKIKINHQIVDLSQAFLSLKNATHVKSKLAQANIKPRLRMTTLYALAQEYNYLVLGTDNAAEWILGYFTKYGDGGVDLLPIVHLTKGDVTKFAKNFNLPEIIYQKPPSAALWEGQTDEAELGYGYDQVDEYIQGKPIDPLIKAKIETQIKNTNHKRVPIPMPMNIESYKKNK